jgi:alkanesulfonate monooxygenase SsuD/methylene tetrahydromethanopterin reductase-like flavin-dependent oxidoreductase (luciferase family)
VPDNLVDEVALIGPPERIRDRLAPWRESGITTMIVGTRQVEVLRTLAETGV